MPHGVNAARVLIKGALIFFGIEALIVGAPLTTDNAGAYGLFQIKRERFPLSTVSPVDAALDVGDLGVMFASHVITNEKPRDEFRVLVLGDSTIWGLQYTPAEVLPGQLNQLALACGVKSIRFYNLSFPRSSATKDIMILDRAMHMKPDAIVWLITWYTLSPKTRADHWLILRNPEDFLRLGHRFDFLPRDYKAPGALDAVVTRNSTLFRTLRYQAYTLVELATGLDQMPGPPQVQATELSADPSFEGLKPPRLRRSQVSLDQVADMYDLAEGVPVLLVNEPILIMKGLPNSDVRYNSYYPRWAYDQYRKHLVDAAETNGWQLIDLWDDFPAEDFADTPLHLVPSAHGRLAEMLAPRITVLCN